jgi:uncharacterized protein (TIGR02444 family)
MSLTNDGRAAGLRPSRHGRFDDRRYALAIARRQGNAAVLRCDSPFWTFSLAVYARPGVAAECLALQDACNIDVNALLFCAWLGAEKGLVLADQNLAAIDAHVRRWHETVVRPLRAVRQAMKPMPEMADDAVTTLRKEIATAELRGEQIEQAILFEAVTALSDRAEAASAAQAVPANVTAFVRRNAGGAAAIEPPCLLMAAALAYHASPAVNDV